MKTDVVSNIAVLGICIGYAIAAWLVQMLRVAAPRDWLLQRVKNTKARIDTEQWEAGPPAKENLSELETRIDKAALFIPTWRVQAGWRHVHELEDARVLELPSAAVDEQLQSNRTRLADDSGPEAKGLATRIAKALNEKDDLDRRRALLQEAEVYLHNRSDTTYEELAALIAKAVWLTLLALAFIVGLTILFDRESYFLLGAAGALISRLTRVLRRAPKSSDWGAAWSTLILSPAAGALAGWIGVLITHVLASEPFDVLGVRFSEPWENALDTLGLVVAFMFGFSERLFDKLLGVAESEIGGKLPAKTGRGKPESGGTRED